MIKLLIGLALTSNVFAGYIVQQNIKNKKVFIESVKESSIESNQIIKLKSIHEHIAEKDKTESSTYEEIFYPNDKLNKIFLHNIKNELYIIPLKIHNSLLKSAYRYYLPTTIDLNFIRNYLPKKIKSIYQTRFKSDLDTYKYLNMICASSKLNEKIGYEITKGEIFSTLGLQLSFKQATTPFHSRLLHLNKKAKMLSSSLEFVRQYIGGVDH